jgi:hypothetical protein
MEESTAKRAVFWFTVILLAAMVAYVRLNR